ncbi:aromatic-ring-hydroxylating dioxygenase subunit beta [Thalassovita taeanensis]|uniref:3-phenylpropionate/cinnamic acid dioxygenase, small subunit n=1 Tax=Thalassovita taeanensis TaxID=657014 RepID=A0A1H9J6D3_9RHOB|nr:aromatic-ring-hydroxylating dioxygenase subunit beta [Thalassovita taeanensis]SEQ82356.1 3-phenylpropionate/cinnamic acid dioxygenase, small subunit [Thalassovita taeanensis]
MKDLPVKGEVTLQDVTEFLWHEADLLDRRDYDTWLALWAEGGFYVIPVDKESEDFANLLNIAYDNATMREMRVRRFQQGFSISSAPPADSVRTVSRFVIEEQDSDTVRVRAAQHVVEDKFGRQRTFAANVTWVLQVTDEGLMIRDKIVRLLNSDGMLTSISYLF